MAIEQNSLAAELAANRIAEEANRIARGQSDLNFWQVILSAAIMVLTGIAVWAAIKAALYAKEAASEGKRAADIAEDALEAANRPQIIIKKVAVTNLKPPPNGQPETAPVFEYLYANYSQTIGWITRATISMGTGEEGRPDHPDIASAKPTHYAVTTDQGWGSATVRPEFTPETRSDIAEGRATLYMLGGIDYRSARGRVYRHRWAYQYEPRRDIMVPWYDEEYWETS